MIGQWEATLAKGTAAARNGKAEATTTRLIALFDDYRLQCRKTKCADQQRQPKFRTTQTDQPAKCADECTTAESNRGAARHCDKARCVVSPVMQAPKRYGSLAIAQRYPL